MLSYYITEIPDYPVGIQCILYFQSTIYILCFVYIVVFMSIIIGILTWLGQLVFPFRLSADTNKWINTPEYQKPRIHIRFVTRGTNPQQILESVYDIYQTIDDIALKNKAYWVVEVLTDKVMDLGKFAGRVTQIVVPDDYQTPNRTLFKARALHYAASNHDVSNDAWILHMDEESYFNVDEGIKLLNWCINENYLITKKGQNYTWGNGSCVYTKQDNPDNWYLTFCDCFRITEDFRYSVGFHWFNACLNGIKGSCWIIHARIEKEVGFDIGANRSVCEDWISGLKFNEAGYKCKWLDFVVEEQSPFNLSDFIKQRSRWRKGLLLNYLYTNDLRWYLRYAILYGAMTMLTSFFGVIVIGLYLGNIFYEHMLGFYLMPNNESLLIKYYMIVGGMILEFSYVAGYLKGRFWKYGICKWTLGFLYFASTVGQSLSGIAEQIACISFYCKCDFREVSFEIINKDSKTNKYNFKENYNYQKDHKGIDTYLIVKEENDREEKDIV